MSPARRATPSLLAAALVLALSGCSPDRQVDPRTEAALVRLATVNSFDQGSRSFTGVVVARVESDLGFRVAGKIVERLVDAGQAVKRGQPLMRIDATDLTLATRARRSRRRRAGTRSANCRGRKALSRAGRRGRGFGLGLRSGEGGCRDRARRSARH